MKRLIRFFKELFNPPTKLRLDKPSPEQISFAAAAAEILGPVLVKYGFKPHRGEIKTYSTTLIYRKKDLYLILIFWILKVYAFVNVFRALPLKT
jgi:hypothetical protein